MAQIRTGGTPEGGTVTLTQGSQLVVASAGADWSQVVPGSNHYFTRGGSNIDYTIAAKGAPGQDGIPTWHLMLAGFYQGPNETNAPYCIQIDFTEHGLPLLAVGDGDTRLVWNVLARLSDRLANTTHLYNEATNAFEEVHIVGTGDTRQIVFP